MLAAFSALRRFLIMPRKGSGGFYGIHSGRRTGVVNSWEECESLVKGFAGAKFKKFKTYEEAHTFALDGSTGSSNGASSSGGSSNGGSSSGGSSNDDSTSSATRQSSLAAEAQRGGGLNRHSVCKKRQHEDEPDVPVVYTDGACSGNGKAGAKAGIGVYWGDGDPRNVSEPLEGKPTNNRAEIQAAARAIQQARNQGFKKVEIRTDSNFLVESATKWIPGWQKKDWKTASGKPVINKDDFKDLLKASKDIEVVWTHVNGHVGIHGNEQADGLAVSGMRKRMKLDE